MTNVLISDSRPIIGESRPAEASLRRGDHVNLASGKVQASIWMSGAREIDAAAEVAVSGQRAWLALAPELRRNCLLRLADLMGADMQNLLRTAALECGTPRGNSPMAPAPDDPLFLWCRPACQIRPTFV